MPKNNPRIVAKYPSTCPTCGGAIHPGDIVEWEKGSKARHVKCRARPAHSAAAPMPAAPAPKHASPPPVQGERTIQRPSRGRDDGYDVGAVLHLPRVSGGGGPDGHYWMVLEAGKRKDYDSDEWQLWGRVRPATDAEAAEPAGRAARAEQRKTDTAKVSLIVRQVANLVEVHPSAGAHKIVIFENAVGSHYLWLDGDTAWETQSSYDDGPHAWRSHDLRAVAIMERLLGISPGTAALARLRTAIPLRVAAWLPAERAQVVLSRVMLA